jgi:signal transduction histidine kinase/DNA-binding response OmpR family regulator
MDVLRKSANPAWESLLELRINTLHKIVWVIGICGWLTLIWTLWPISYQAVYRLQMRPVAVLLLTAAGLSYFLVQRNILMAALVQLGSMLVATVSVVGITHTVETAHLLVIPVIFASVLIGQRAVIVTASLILVFNLLVAPAWIGVNWTEFVVPTIILVFTVIAVIISTSNLYTALWWTFSSFEVARINQDMARDRKAELEQVLKSMDVSATNLRRLNYALWLAQQRAEEARQIKQQFAQTISHELRTPLNLIVGFTDTMIQSPEYYGQPLPPRYLRDLSIVYRNANHLQNLVNDVLDMARIEAAQMTLQIELQVMQVFLEDVVNMAKSMVETQGLRFVCDIEADLPDLWIDAIRIKQVIYNLLSNAVRFTPEGSITLSVHRQVDVLLFAVADTGIGIEAADIPLIFEPFRQLENPMRRRIGGAGLGLPISRQLVEMHGGELNVESTPRNGSTFSFDIPINVENLTDNPRRYLMPGSAFATREANVLLIITQNLSAASLLARHLEHYRTMVAQDLQQAQSTMDQTIPQAIIFDTNSVNMDIEVINTCRNLDQTLLIKCPLPNQTLSQEKLSIDGYLVKPVSRESMRDMLRRLNKSIEHILIVDDDPDFVRMIERMMDTPVKHYRISRAQNGREAMTVIRHHQPDLVLLDLQMPDMDGTEILKWLRSSDAWSDTPVVVVSALDEIDMATPLEGNLTIGKLHGLQPIELMNWLRRFLEAHQ